MELTGFCDKEVLCERVVAKPDDDDDDDDEDDAKELRQFRDEKGAVGDQGHGKGTAGG